MARDLRGARALLHGEGPLHSAVADALLGAEARVVDGAEGLDVLVVLGDPSPGREDLDRALERGFVAPVRAIRAALPALETSGGRIVAVVGPDARQPRTGHAPAAAAAHALRGFVTTLHSELAAGRRGVRADLLELDVAVPRVVAAAVLDALR